MSKKPDLSQLLTSAEAAKYVGCALVTIRQNVARKNIYPFSKVGGTYLFTLSQVKRFKRRFKPAK